MAGKEDKKNVVWMFDRQTGVMSVDVNKSNKADIEARFSFKLEVYKDSETHVESMKITNFKDRNENGSIVTSIVDLGRDIKDFKRFGVVMGDTYYRDLARRIEEEYVNIEVSTVTFATGDTRYSDFLGEVKEFFIGSTEYISDDFCYVPVNMFNELFTDCGYSEYEMKNLRTQLAQGGYIHVVSGRYAILKRLSNKPERVVAFYREKLGITLPIKQEKRKKVKGDGDE